MFAQIVKVRTKPGSGERIAELNGRWEEEVGRGTDSGWVRTSFYKNATDPNEYYLIAHFESEEKARRNEQGERHQALMQELGGYMDGEPSYVDLEHITDSSR